MSSSDAVARARLAALSSLCDASRRSQSAGCAARLLWASLAALSVGCAHRYKINVPDSLRGASAQRSADKGSADKADARTPDKSQDSRYYVVKINDGQREWNVWLPPVNGGYEVRIPLGGGEPLLPAGLEKSKPVLLKDSAEYKLAVARVQALYQRKSYDVALIELGKLRAEFPDDAKLAAMEGTIYFKMGDKEKAQRAWERAVDLDPENNTILEMLQGIK